MENTNIVNNDKKLRTWKNLSLNGIFLFQVLFLATTSADFFLTVLHDGVQSYIFSLFSSGVTALIVVPWLLGIIFLSVLLLSFLHQRETNPLTIRVTYEYSLFVVLYAFLTVLGIINPMIPIAQVVTYIINMCWAISLIYFRVTIHKALSEE